MAPKIKRPKSVKTLSDIEAADAWAKFSVMLRKVLNHDVSFLSFEECYRRGYQLVVSKQGRMLYDGVSDLIVESLNRLSEDIISSTFRSGLEKDPVQRGQEEERLLV
ncbi:hypothetical protein BJV78DRAFT_1225903 [Lactifluus subvellereus]|nr:hypothetical protein BJV78DRAFT_1225903 [Lactifluus subvellereus]